MPLPKRRHSKARGRRRRTHWKLATPQLSKCPHCHQLRRVHQVCPHCGYYGDKEVLTPKEA